MANNKELRRRKRIFQALTATMTVAAVTTAVPNVADAAAVVGAVELVQANSNSEIKVSIYSGTLENEETAQLKLSKISLTSWEEEDEITFNAKLLNSIPVVEFTIGIKDGTLTTSGDTLIITGGNSLFISTGETVIENALTLNEGDGLGLSLEYSGNWYGSDTVFLIKEGQEVIDNSDYKINASINRTSGIQVTANISAGHRQPGVVIFQLFKKQSDGNDEPVGIVALEKDDLTNEAVTSHFNVSGEEYYVKVFVFDRFTSDTNLAPTSLAEPVIVGK